MRKLLRMAVTMALAAIAWATTGWVCSAEAALVVIDAKETELTKVLELLAAQGGPALVADPAVAKEKITFAVKEVEPQEAVRWLCRACRFVVVPGQGGRLTVGPPSLDKAVRKEYKVASVAATSAATDGLVSFIKRVIFASYLNRAKAENGEVVPELEATVANTRLTIVAPSMVQREVTALLRTIARVTREGSFKVLQVSYRPYELGMLNPRAPVPLPAIGKSDTSLDLAQVSAFEAAWALTSASDASFFIDPWDEELKEARVTLKAEKMSLRVVVAELGKQLRAEPVWFDGAYLFARASRRGLWEDFSVRVYNFEGRGGWANFALEAAERRAQGRGSPLGPRPPGRPGDQAEDRSGNGLPYAVNRVGDYALAALPQERHKDVESSQRGGPPAGPPGPPRPPRSPRR